MTPTEEVLIEYLRTLFNDEEILGWNDSERELWLKAALLNWSEKKPQSA
jgi:hypothetical protein